MPPLTRNKGDRALQVMVANPAMRSHAVATGQQTGTSGTIPGTSSDPTQVATQTGTIQSYPNGPSPNGDTIAGVGHAILNNDGNPVVVMGNLNATQTSGTDLPSNFQDGGFAFVDKNGNLTAGYSQSTGLWGFGSGSGGVGLVSNYYLDNQTREGAFVALNGPGEGYIVADMGGASWSTWLANGRIIQPGIYAQTLSFYAPSGWSGINAVVTFDTDYGLASPELVDLAQMAALDPTGGDVAGPLASQVFTVTQANIDAGQNYPEYYVTTKTGVQGDAQAVLQLYPIAIGGGGGGGGGGLQLASFSDEIRSQQVLCSPGTYTQLTDWSGNDVSWFDATNNAIISPGLYVELPGVNVASVGSAKGMYAQVQGCFDLVDYLPLDAMTLSYPLSNPGWVLSDCQVLGPNDVPFSVTADLSIPAAATGWELHLNSVIGRLIY